MAVHDVTWIRWGALPLARYISAGQLGLSAAGGRSPWRGTSDALTYSAAINTCISVHRQLAAGLLAVMREAEWVPNVFTYSAAIHACGMARWQLALGLLTAMLEADLAPDALTCSVAINA